MLQTPDWVGLVSALILLITAVTLAINLWNQRQIADLHVQVKTINGSLQAQMKTKEDKASTFQDGDTRPLTSTKP